MSTRTPVHAALACGFLLGCSDHGPTLTTSLPSDALSMSGQNDDDDDDDSNAGPTSDPSDPAPTGTSTSDPSPTTDASASTGPVDPTDPQTTTSTTTATTTSPETTDPDPTADTTDPDPGTTAPPADCGNGIVDPGETCDDGDLDNSDTCPMSCQPAVCGDGYIWTIMEVCDDGNLTNGDGCSDECFPEFEKYTAVGPQQDVNFFELDGWVACYIAPYDSAETSLASIKAGCTKANIMLGCHPYGSDTLTLLAHGPRDMVFKDTGQSNTPTIANGTAWYFNDSYSWGFAKQGDTISRQPCDTQATNGQLRLCWNTKDKYMGDGFRCGANDLTGDDTWERYILEAD